MHYQACPVGAAVTLFESTCNRVFYLVRRWAVHVTHCLGSGPNGSHNRLIN